MYSKFFVFFKKFYYPAQHFNFKLLLNIQYFTIILYNNILYYTSIKNLKVKSLKVGLFPIKFVVLTLLLLLLV